MVERRATRLLTLATLTALGACKDVEQPLPAGYKAIAPAEQQFLTVLNPGKVSTESEYEDPCTLETFGAVRTVGVGNTEETKGKTLLRYENFQTRSEIGDECPNNTDFPMDTNELRQRDRTPNAGSYGNQAPIVNEAKRRKNIRSMPLSHKFTDLPRIIIPEDGKVKTSKGEQQFQWIYRKSILNGIALVDDPNISGVSFGNIGALNITINPSEIYCKVSGGTGVDLSAAETPTKPAGTLYMYDYAKSPHDSKTGFPLIGVDIPPDAYQCRGGQIFLVRNPEKKPA